MLPMISRLLLYDLTAHEIVDCSASPSHWNCRRATTFGLFSFFMWEPPHLDQGIGVSLPVV